MPVKKCPASIARSLVVTLACLAPVACDKKATPAAAAGGKSAGGEVAPVEVALAPVAMQPLQRFVPVTGSLYGEDEATISAKVPGRMVSIAKDLGDRAAPGEPLAQIEQTDYALARSQKQLAIEESLAKIGLRQIPGGDFDPSTLPTVQRARLQAENAEVRLQRGQRLHEQKPPLISEQDYTDLRTAYDVARANYDVELLTARALLAEARTLTADLDLAVQRLSDTTIRAPGESAPSTAPATNATAGPTTRPARYAVAARTVSVGEYVREGAPLFRVVVDNPLKYRAAVPERFIGNVRVGQSIRLSALAYPGRTFEGTITRVSPEVDVQSRAFQVEARVPNDEGLLKPGSFAEAMLLTHVDEDAVMVPREAVYTFAGVNRVFTVKDGKAVEIRVNPGQSTETHVEIPGGLKGAAQVVVSNTDKLATGVPVEVAPSPTASTR